MISFPNAKINIGLFVTQKRIDGYHNIETVFYPLKGFHDALEIVEINDGLDDLSLKIFGHSIKGDLHDNLVYKAYHLVCEKFPHIAKSPLLVYLIKHIPSGAGLGGGSADASFMLRLLNNYFNLNLSNEELLIMALKLGSDCPFFISNIPVFAQGRGEIFTPVDLDLSQYSFQLITPRIHISTTQAFEQISIAPASFNLTNIATLPICDWKYALQNSFEDSVFKKFPILKEYKSKFYEQDAIYAQMSGSGSAIYAIFDKHKKAEWATSSEYETYYFE